MGLKRHRVVGIGILLLIALLVFVGCAPATTTEPGVTPGAVETPLGAPTLEVPTTGPVGAPTVELPTVAPLETPTVEAMVSPTTEPVGAPTVEATPGDGMGPVTIDLGPGRDGSQTGTATLTAQNGSTEVVIDIQPGAAGVAQPAHIHQGDCPGVGAVQFPLENVVDGQSTTVVPASLSDIMSGNWAINVHQSADQVDVYVSCGELPQ